MLLLDTDAVPVSQRVEAFHYTHNQASVPKLFSHEEHASGLRARVEAWQLDGLTLFASSNTGFRLTRTARHVRQEAVPVIGIALQNEGVGRSEANGEQQLLGQGDIHLCNEMVPHHYGWSQHGSAQALLIDLDRLAVPMDSVQKAVSRLHASPMHSLVHQHLRSLWQDPGAIEKDPSAPTVARATVELVRALVISAAEDERSVLSRSVMDDTLLSRVQAHVLQRLADPKLSAERIAHEHGISVRHLFGVFQRAGISLEQWIISERLDRAREDLASEWSERRTIEAISRRWGFSRPSHFSRRFREKYGLSPSEWRRQARTTDPASEDIRPAP
ncbi:helix-turn-helix domain-containing protein [Streptomyces sp. YS415]|uniref:helix-turn-helix domain-containing protein n=1 Tax=Streptomyces sp. YS415 TaxID=2944806 RepID=UPI0020218D1C|nr:helix-turn-helix domain-containing protein [Streptomyces sp. YS415]MCL7429146.1 helix-turn-helix domain-containing protein [Streptomyces sp. YS415]